MAGIGFELRGAVARDANLGTRLRAWTAAGLVSSGPWLATVGVLVFLHLAAPHLASAEDYERFRGVVTYTFAFSLLVVGVVQMAVTRQVADELWLGRHDRVMAGYAATMAVVGALQLALGAAVVGRLELGRVASVLAVGSYVASSWAWVSLIWLGAVRDHGSVLRAYVLGALVTVGVVAGPALLGGGLGSLLGRPVPWAVGPTGLAGLLFAFTLGQGVTLVLLIGAILRGLEPSERRGFDLLVGAASRGSLVALGAIYAYGIWADKFVFWMTQGLPVLGALRHHPLYDSCAFLAHATVVPALALHLVRAETTFYERYREFYETLSGGAGRARAGDSAPRRGGTLAEIRAAEARMFEALRGSMVRIVRVQAWVSLAAIVLAPELLAALGMPASAVPVFRVLAVGAYFHVLFLLTLLVLLYFDLRRPALAAAGVFAAANTALPYLSAAGPPGAYGLGYALAALAGLVVALRGLQGGLRRLVLDTFARELGRA